MDLQPDTPREQLMTSSQDPQQQQLMSSRPILSSGINSSIEDSRMDTSEEPASSVPDREGVVRAAVFTIQTSANKVAAKAACKAIVKLLAAILKKPDDKKVRQLRLDNLIIKKFVLGTPGGKELFLALGFVEEEVAKGVQYLSLELEAAADSAELRLVQAAVDLLEGSPAQAPAQASAAGAGAAAVDALRERKLCLGGCGLWGDPDRGDLCSVCYKVKFGIAMPPKKKAAALCTKGCGFFGQEQWDGMCSKCFNADQNNPKLWRRKFHRARIRLRGVLAFCSLLKVREVQQVNKSRCWKCNRKVGLLGIECRCRYVFCGQHRYADEHDCSYDFKRRHQRLLANQNKLVQHDKLERLDDEE